MYVHYRDRAAAQEVQVTVLPKQVTLWMAGFELLSTHDKVAGKVTA